ncbi:MAG: hypothetical protein ACKO11_03270 [Cuspidothrix sp.]
MAAIIISDLAHIEDKKTFLHNLDCQSIQLILGGFVPFLGGLGGLGPADFVQLTTVYDGINNQETAYRGPFSFYENKILTADFSRTAFYLIV